jgi:hypothetical protein
VAGGLRAQALRRPAGLLAQEALGVVREQADEHLGDDPAADRSQPLAAAGVLRLALHLVPERRLGLERGPVLGGEAELVEAEVAHGIAPIACATAWPEGSCSALPRRRLSTGSPVLAVSSRPGSLSSGRARCVSNRRESCGCEPSILVKCRQSTVQADGSGRKPLRCPKMSRSASAAAEKGACPGRCR